MNPDQPVHAARRGDVRNVDADMEVYDGTRWVGADYASKRLEPEATFIIAELPDGRYTAWLTDTPAARGETILYPHEDVRSTTTVMAAIADVVADAGLRHFAILRQPQR